MSERDGRVPDLDEVWEKLRASGLPPYRWTEHDEYALAVQAAAFGEGVPLIKPEERQELVSDMKKIKEWLKVHGFDERTHPDFANVSEAYGKGIRWFGETLRDSSKIYVKSENQPWTNGAAANLENDPKFEIRLKNSQAVYDFTYYFDGTYSLALSPLPKQVEDPVLRIEGLKLTAMTKAELSIVNYCIGRFAYELIGDEKVASAAETTA